MYCDFFPHSILLIMSLLHLLGKRKASEEKTIPSKHINMHIGAVNVTCTGVGRFWEALQLMEIDDEDMFLSLPTGIFFCGENDRGSSLLIRRCYHHLVHVIFTDNVTRRWRITGTPGIGKTFFGYYLIFLLA